MNINVGFDLKYGISVLIFKRSLFFFKVINFDCFIIFKSQFEEQIEKENDIQFIYFSFKKFGDII